MQQQQFLSRALERIRALPGIVAASATTGFPVFGGFGTEVDVPGVPHDDRWQTTVEFCSDGYFRTLGVRLLKGRDFSSADVSGTRDVAIVNRLLVDRYMTGVEPIGRQLRVMIGRPPVPRTYEIVGVVADAKNNGISNPPNPEVFLPAYAEALRSYAFIVRTAGPASAQIAAVKRELWAADRTVAISDTSVLIDMLRRFAYGEPRLGLYVFGAFAAIGLVLVAVGIYSLIAYTVARQKREIGIRMAIGASRGDVLRMTLGLGLRWIAAGVGLGLAASLAATRALSNQLIGISPTDTLTFASVILIVCVSGFAATYIPARRATAVDPNVVLRAE
jgi:predicted permease